MPCSPVVGSCVMLGHTTWFATRKIQQLLILAQAHEVQRSVISEDYEVLMRVRTICFYLQPSSGRRRRSFVTTTPVRWSSHNTAKNRTTFVSDSGVCAGFIGSSCNHLHAKLSANVGSRTAANGPLIDPLKLS